jgi:hypothetical protein
MGLLVNVDKNFESLYIIPESKENVAELKTLKDADEALLATDETAKEKD